MCVFLPAYTGPMITGLGVPSILATDPVSPLYFLATLLVPVSARVAKQICKLPGRAPEVVSLQSLVPFRMSVMRLQELSSSSESLVSCSEVHFLHSHYHDPKWHSEGCLQ